MRANAMEKKGIRMAASTILTTAIQEDTKTRIAYTTWISTKTNQRKIDNFAFSPSHSSSAYCARFYVEQDVNEQNISFVYAINFSVETKIKRVNDVIWRESVCVRECVLTTVETAHDGAQKKINKAITVDWATTAAISSSLLLCWCHVIIA